MFRALMLSLLHSGALCQNSSVTPFQTLGISLNNYRKHSATCSGDIGEQCHMDAYTGAHPWKTDTKYYYNSVQECADLCDAQLSCAGFKNWWNPFLSTPHCVFLMSASTRPCSGGIDLYQKIAGVPTPPPPPAPAPGQSCALSGWPVFNSQEELESSDWPMGTLGSSYLYVVYQQEYPKFTYPFCFGDFLVLYDKLLEGFEFGVVPSVQDQCPSASSSQGFRYKQNNMYQPIAISHSWRKPPYAAIPANTWVEVSHMADPFGDEHYGLWLLLATGNGIWFNTGKTADFQTHWQAYTEFGVSTGMWNEEMCKEAALRDYDSVQFTEHEDHVNYPCDHQAGAKYMNLEIVAVKLTGTYACGAAGGAPSAIRAGWMGSKPCNCDESMGTLNCGRFWWNSDASTEVV